MMYSGLYLLLLVPLIAPHPVTMHWVPGANVESLTQIGLTFFPNLILELS